MSGDTGWTVIRLNRGELLPDALVEYARSRGWKSGVISGIGAVSEVSLAFYDFETQSYIQHRLDDTVEVVAMNGNLTTVDDLPFWHIHMVVADREGRCYGGHLVACKVALTLECSIWPSDQLLTREFDASLGLKLLKV